MQRPRVNGWAVWDREFSKRLGARGWVGMNWPKMYGGGERTAFERLVVVEELLAAGAPASAHWIADRQAGPMLLRFGSEAQRAELLPKMAAGECGFCLGMSEPDSGSDLASVSTRATPVDGGWLLNGTKLWTSHAHRAEYMMLFCRSGHSGETEGRHSGVSQFVVDMRTPGLEIRPVYDQVGSHDFNEVTFTDAFVPETALVGEEGAGWRQVMSELALERSGAERFMSSFVLMREAVRALEGSTDPGALRLVGRLTSHLWTLRNMSLSIAGLLQAGASVDLEAALLKDLGAVLEQEIPEVVRLLVDSAPMRASEDALARLLGEAVLLAPTFSLRGGTREVLRNIISRGLGLR